MKALYTLIMTLGLVAFSPSYAGDAAAGEKTFTASTCASKCHGSDIFTKADRKVKNLAALESKVRMCDTNLNTNWFDEDIHNVTAYLNQRYYKFK